MRERKRWLKHIALVGLPATLGLIAIFILFEYSYVADLREWLADASARSGAERGELLFETRGCSDCHSLVRDHFQGIGPSLHPDSLAMTPAETRIAILYPNRTISRRCSESHPCQAGVMPSYADKLDETQVSDLIAYLVSPRTPPQP